MVTSIFGHNLTRKMFYSYCVEHFWNRGSHRIIFRDCILLMMCLWYLNRSLANPILIMKWRKDRFTNVQSNRCFNGYNNEILNRDKQPLYLRNNQANPRTKMGKRKGRSGICGFSSSFLYRLVTLFLIFLVVMCYKIMMKFNEYDARQKMIEEQRI